MSFVELGSLGGLAAFIALVAGGVRAAYVQTRNRDRQTPDAIARAAEIVFDASDRMSATLAAAQQQVADLQQQAQKLAVELKQMQALYEAEVARAERYLAQMIEAGIKPDDG